jgi:TetR/AcrR family transcriptional repressor of nem operon
MSRPKEYDREEVLAKITELFWEKGFEATSINEIVARTGLNKHSLYNEFGDKEILFLLCIDEYVNKSIKELGDILTKEPLGLSNIEAFFDNRVAYASSGSCKGCLLINSVTEKETLSKKINQKVISLLSNLNKVSFYNCLKAAQENNEISRDKNCEVLASYLTCFLFGLVNVGKNETRKNELRKIADAALLVVKN